MTTTEERLQAVRARIDAACGAAGRDRATVGLLAVSKLQPPQCVIEAIHAGQRTFGENYAQEGAAKAEAVATALAGTGLERALEWHFIGPLQSNKTALVARSFDWVHTVDRLKIAQRLSAQRDVHLAPLQVCIQVNVSGEASKGGVAPADVSALAHALAELPHLTLRGLMCIPEASEDRVLLRGRFRELRQLRDNLNAEGLALDTLSMGMSHDFELAVAEGATIVRVGSAIFGERRQT